MSRRLDEAIVRRLLNHPNRVVTRYKDDMVFTYYDNMVELIPELEEAMGSDDGEIFDFDGNLNT